MVIVLYTSATALFSCFLENIMFMCLCLSFVVNPMYVQTDIQRAEIAFPSMHFLIT